MLEQEHLPLHQTSLAAYDKLVVTLTDLGLLGGMLKDSLASRVGDDKPYDAFKEICNESPIANCFKTKDLKKLIRDGFDK